MSQNNITLLTTRPLAHTTLMYARDKGVMIDTISFIETNSIVNETVQESIRLFSKKECAAVFTSMNGAEAVIDSLSVLDSIPEWTVYTMGGITQKIVEDYFVESEVIGESKNATEVARAIIANEEQEVVFFCGNQRREELPNHLKQAGIKVNELVVYETIETPVAISKNYHGILFFSPSAVRSFFSLNQIDNATVLFAIGTTSAIEIKKFCNNRVMVAATPHKEQLAEKAIDFFTTA